MEKCIGDGWIFLLIKVPFDATLWNEHLDSVTDRLTDKQLVQPKYAISATVLVTLITFLKTRVNMAYHPYLLPRFVPPKLLKFSNIQSSKFLPFGNYVTFSSMSLPISLSERYFQTRGKFATFYQSKLPLPS